VVIGAASFDIGMNLTPEVRTAVRTALRVIEKEIARYLRAQA
jgi:Ni,Fe-hydrogenase maturation factor